MYKNLFFSRNNKRSRVLSFLMVFVIAFIPMVFNFPSSVHAATTLNVYPAPAGVPMNNTYTVQVQVPGGPWQALDVYQTQVNGYSGNKASFAYFDTDGPVNYRWSIILQVFQRLNSVIRAITLHPPSTAIR